MEKGASQQRFRACESSHQGATAAPTAIRPRPFRELPVLRPQAIRGVMAGPTRAPRHYGRTYLTRQGLTSTHDAASVDWLRWGEREWGWGFAIFASQPGYLYPSIPTGAPARLTDDTPFWGHGLDFSGCLCPRIRVTPSAQTATCAADH